MSINTQIRIWSNPSGNLSFCKSEDNRAGLTVIIVMSGSLQCTVNHSHYFISAKNVAILSDIPYLDTIEASNDFKGYLLTFDKDFLEDLHSVGLQRLRRNNDLIVRRLTGEDVRALKLYVSALAESLTGTEDDYGQEISVLMAKAIICKILAQCDDILVDDNETRTRKDVIANEFVKLVKQHGLLHRDLEFYAGELCITPKYLSSVVSKTTGKKALKWLEDHAISEAMKKLKTTDMNVNQISDALNFHSPSDFCRTFRKNTGMTPNAYRKMKGAFQG